ncbi:type VI secretion system lipoprotein TssJ [Pantoea endophytica]|uniref:type VI secretion system lipoprotein TssJ n=1 Tax=Pantoea endophytica TaxID=92488 RepID=UPI00301AF9EE
MRNYLILVLLFFNVSCSQFFSEKEIVQPKKCEIKVTASREVNPNDRNIAQPVRVCVIESKRAGWLSPHLYEGVICSGLASDTDIINHETWIIAPGQNRLYRTTCPESDTQPRWIIIGAEFQQGIGARSVIEKEIPTAEDSIIHVFVEKTSLITL